MVVRALKEAEGGTGDASRARNGVGRGKTMRER